MSMGKRHGGKDKRKYIRGKPLNIPVSIQNKYTNAITDLTERMTKELERELTKLFEAGFAQAHFEAIAPETVGMDAPALSSQARILMNAMKRKYDQLFGKQAMGLSPWMADNMDRASASGVRKSVGEMPNLKDEGRKLTISVKQLDAPTKQLLKVSSARSANFITSIPEKHLNSVADAVYKSITSGNGMQDLKPFLEKQASSIKNWAHNTAMDQTRKTYNDLNKGRMQKIGITKGEWIHSGGSNHPRELHEEFDGQTYDLSVGAPVGDDGGNNVDPGEEPNCRCSFAPVVMFDDDDEE